MRRFGNWQIVLAGLFGLLVVLWTLTGLIIAVSQGGDMPGTDLRAKPALIDTSGLVLPRVTVPVRSVELIAQPEGPAWIVTEQNGRSYRYSAQDGMAIAPVIETEAARIAQAAYTGDAALTGVTLLDVGHSPSNLREGSENWQARFADGTHIYISESTGEVLRLQTRWWQTFGALRSSHGNDWHSRDDIRHPLQIIIAAIGLAGSILGLVLSLTLVMRRRKARQKISPAA